MSTSKKPNFLVLVADDLGFSDLGCYGGEIRTPNLDKLADEGLRMTGFHTASACSPTRAMLLSGTDSHLAGMGQMIDRIQRNAETRKHYENQLGYEGILNQRVVALSEILNQKRPEEEKGEYRTLLSGKWHLGFDEKSIPSGRGFERSWGLLPGCDNHFKYRARNKAGVEHPTFMHNKYADGSRIFPDSELPEDFYSTKTYTDKMLEWLQEDDDRPFYAMMTYTAPHWPIQAPQAFSDHYRGVYDEGPDVLRRKRMEALVKKGLIPQSAMDKAHPMLPMYKTRDWDALTPDLQRRHSRIMEVYAGMVECLDYHVGRLIELLKKQGKLDNTFILFMSDNGAEGSIAEATPLRGRAVQQLRREYYDMTTENIGKANSFHHYGPRWAQAATAPSRLYKCWVTEGGIRCPCIVRYPPMGEKMQDGAISHAFTTVMDICPTVLELAGIPHPGTSFMGRTVYKPKGASWTPLLKGSVDAIHADDHVVGWELFGQQAIRKGEWKAVFVPAPSGKDRWELFNLKDDPGETEDLYERETRKLDELLAHWEEYEAETGMVRSVSECFGGEGDAQETEDW